LRLPFGKKYVVHCPDGSDKVVFVNPDDAFPLTIKDWYSKWDVVAKFLNRIDASLRAEIGKQLAGQIFELDHSNRSMQISFRAAYNVYIIDPCKRDDWFADRVREIIQAEGMLREKALEIEKLNSAGDLSALSERLMALMARKTEEEKKKELKDVFAKAQDDFQKWGAE
jgi:hypothetical protein